MRKAVISIFAIMALVSCSDGDGPRDGVGGTPEIGFKIEKSFSTRNTPSDSPEFGDGDNIYVTGLHVKKNGGQEIYFKGIEFSKTSKDGISYWGSNPEWDYPYDGTLYFLAYSTAKPVTAQWNGNDNIDNVTLPFGDALDGTEDVTYSNYLKVDCYGVNDEPKPLTFSHALAWLNFKVKRDEASTPAGVVTINSITVNNVALSGTLQVTPSIAADGKTAVEAEWTAKSTLKNAAVPGFEATALDAEIPLANGLMVLPGNQTSFTVNYSYKFDDSHVVEGLEYTYPLTATDTWEMGKKYLYTITIGLKEITVEVQSIGSFE